MEIIIYFLCGSIIGFFIYKFLIAKNLYTQNQIDQKYVLKTDNEELKNELKNKELRINELTLEKGKWENKEKEYLELKQKFSTEFENIANKILEIKSQKFTEQNKSNIETILNPFKENIKELKEKIENTHKIDYSQRNELKTQIETLKTLSEKMKGEAENLTQALKGNKQLQGKWGEDMLEQIIQASGLEKDIHYKTQDNQKDEDGKNLRTDFIIFLPDNKTLIIDSKLTLNSYIEYIKLIENPTNKDEAEKTLKIHIQNIEKHIEILSSKNYFKLYEKAPEFVLMFIALEPAYLTALHNKPSLQYDAMEKNVILVSATTLFATLKTVATLWKNENQKRNVNEIVNQAGSLYDKFVGFYDNLKDVGSKMLSAKDSYDSAMKQLYDGKDNLVRKVEKIRALGANNSKLLDKNLLNRAISEE